MDKANILVVGLDRQATRTIASLVPRKYQALEHPHDSEIISFLGAHHVELVILTAGMFNPAQTLTLARQISTQHIETPILFMATHTSEALLLEALRSGVSDFCQMPADTEELAQRIDHCLTGTVNGHHKRHSGAEHVEIIGESAKTQAMRTFLAHVARSESHVLITGETGTGKELVAAYLHRLSLRQHQPFVGFNCAAIPDSLLESELFGHERGAFTGADLKREGMLLSANRGTVFFDEIGDMSLYAQAKILRALETKKIQRLGARRAVPLDVRVLAATNQELEHLITEGKFRKDLFFRLNVVRIRLPPLRERKDDIEALSTHFIQQFNQCLRGEVKALNDGLMSAFLQYDWPGNVRELKNVLEAMYVTHRAAILTWADLPEYYQACMKGPMACTTSERDRMISALQATNWNKSKTAAELQWSRMTLYRKMAKYKITAMTDQIEVSPVASFIPQGAS